MGTPNKATVEYNRTLAEAQHLAAEGISHAAIDMMDPLGILIHAMRFCAHQGLWFKAAEFAAMACPYTSPRLSTVVQKTVPFDTPLKDMTDRELFNRIAEIDRRMAMASDSTIDGEADNPEADDPLPGASKLQ